MYGFLVIYKKNYICNDLQTNLHILHLADSLIFTDKN